MPFVRIDVIRNEYIDEQLARIGTVVYDALRSIGVPEDDRFQIITEHPDGGIVYGRRYFGLERTAGFVAIQITLNAGRTLEQKKALYTAIAEGLARQVGTRREDVFINLVETAKENWSFGNGEAQYADAG
jgi:phenylpyruvate tautomerase PptA (4-oxalocrotonate tautomerase family)